MKTISEMQTEFKEHQLIKCFEIAHNVDEYVTWWIEDNGTGLYARPSESDLQSQQVEWEDCFTLDEHLQELHSACLTEMIDNQYEIDWER